MHKFAVLLAFRKLVIRKPKFIKYRNRKSGFFSKGPILGIHDSHSFLSVSSLESNSIYLKENLCP